MFDSGLGGLTVFRSLIDLLPAEPVTYFGDTGRFPYGPRPAHEVVEFSIEIGDLLVDAGAKLLVVACNSATSAALDVLEDRYDVPVVGVVEPGVRAAAAATRSGRVGVIGTTGTIASGAYQRAAARRGLELTAAACPGFVEYVEAGDVHSPEVHALARELLAPVREAGVDTLVLGCTHYPMLARTISDVMGREVVLVSSADETAFEVRRMLRPAAGGPAGGGGEEPSPAPDPAVAGRRVALPASAAGSAIAVAPAPAPAPAPVGPRARARTNGSADHAPASNGPAVHRFLTSGDAATFRRLGGIFCGPEVDHVETWTWS